MAVLSGGVSKTGGSAMTVGGGVGGALGGAVSAGVGAALQAAPVILDYLTPQQPMQGYVAQTVPIAPSQTYYGGATNTAVNNNATQNTTNSQQNIYNESTYAPYENKAYGALNFIQSGEQPKMPLGQLAAYQPSQVIAQAIQPQAPYQMGAGAPTNNGLSDATPMNAPFLPAGVAPGQMQEQGNPQQVPIPENDGTFGSAMKQANAMQQGFAEQASQAAGDRGRLRKYLGEPPPDFQQIYQQAYQQALRGMSAYARSTPQGRAQAAQIANIQTKSVSDAWQQQQSTQVALHGDDVSLINNANAQMVDAARVQQQQMSDRSQDARAIAKEVNDLKQQLRATPPDENGGNSARMGVAMSIVRMIPQYAALDPDAQRAIAEGIEKANPVNPEVAERTKKLIADRRVAQGTVQSRIGASKARATIAQVTAKYAQPMAALGLDIKKLDKDIKAIAAKYGEAKAKAQLQHLATQDKYLNNSIARGYFADYMRAREAEGKELERADMAGLDSPKDQYGKPLVNKTTGQVIPGTVGNHDPNSAGAPFAKRAGEFKNMADGMEGAATGGNTRPTRVPRSAAPAQLTAGQQNIIGQLKNYFPNNGLSQAMNELGYTDTVKAGQYLEQLWNNTGGNAVAVARAIEIARRARM